MITHANSILREHIAQAIYRAIQDADSPSIDAHDLADAVLAVMAEHEAMKEAINDRS